jgi:hypothetical protein
LVALCVTAAISSTPARADIIQIPAITFVHHRGGGGPLGFVVSGTLSSGAGTYYAPVPFPADGQLVCKFTLVHRALLSSQVTARLMKKPIVGGSDPFAPPVEMASVGPVDTTGVVTRAIDTSIQNRVIDRQKAFYYVEVTIAGGNPADIQGVQIEFGPGC